MDAARMEDARPATLGRLSGQPTAPRPPTTPKRSTTGDVVLAVQSLPAEGDDADGDLTGEGFDEQVVDDHGNRVSMYVRAFEEMLNTVLEQESYLFSSTELATFDRYRALSYNARYLLTRLMLRKPRIFRLVHLERSYAGELGRHVASAMDELSVGFKAPPQKPANEGLIEGVRKFDKGKGREGGNGPGLSKGGKGPSIVMGEKSMSVEKTDVINLLSSSDDEQPSSDVEILLLRSAKPSSNLKKTKPAPAPVAGPSVSADVVSALSLEEDSLDLGWFCSNVEDESEEKLLRSLKMEEVREVARGMKCWKAGLTYDGLVDVVLKSVRSQTTLSFPALPFKPPDDALKQATLPFGGSAPQKKVDGSKRLIKVVLEVMGKAMVVNPDVRRLWGRLNLIFYRSTMTPPSLLLPQILTKAQKRHYPSYTYARTLSLFPTRGSLVAYEKALALETEVDDALGEQETLNGRRPFSKHFEGKAIFGNAMGRKEGAEVVRAIWRLVWERWKGEVEAAQRDGLEKEGARTVKDRFQPGHVLTRIVYKGAYGLGVLHDYEDECMVLRALLGQRVWRRGKRGAWYERLALILMTHYKGPEQREKRMEAWEVCLDALEDDDTHLIYRPSLARRLTRLEKMLDIPYKERHVCDGSLAEPIIVTLSAPRIRVVPPPAGSDDSEDEVDGQGAKKRTGGEGATTYGTKSAWVGREGGEVGVEQWVLEQWEDKGWKGFHAEGSIVTTIFGLLFWDVIFADVPGVFETPYQSAPLDLGEDTFALARSTRVRRRLEQIAAGEALTILREVDERERDKGTLCVGVRWEFERDDLREIVECLGGTSLEVICRMLSEEYGHRSSGVPDLLVWKYDEGRARFVEVKGPGDRLSSTQQVWLDVLISAGVEVEVCKVVEAGKEDLRSMSRSVSPVKRKQSMIVDEDEEEEEEEGVEWDAVRAVEGVASVKNKKKRTST